MKKINIPILFLFDLLTLSLPIYGAYALRQVCETFDNAAPILSLDPIHGLIYLLLFSSLIIEGIYTKRYDFWQETYHIIKSAIISLVVILAILALIQKSDQYSRFILIAIFLLFMAVLPIQKYVIKRLLFKIGTWKIPSKVLGEDVFFTEHVYKNPYLGYVPCENVGAKTLFVSSTLGIEKLEILLHDAVIKKQDVIFIPLVRNFNFTDANIIHLFNAHANLIIVENNLLNKTNLLIKWIVDVLLALLLLPFMLIAMAVIGVLIKLDDGGKIFFTQIRLGKNSQEFNCYKFRTMKANADELLTLYLQIHPEEKSHYDTYHKYKNDPRITKIGSLLRKTSLDELPQILNVLKGEMSLIGPRPYLPSEESKLGLNLDLILAVKPGITGLWQVSGRNEVDFKNRVELDVWYVRNWSMWNDIVILIKTIQVVLWRKGAS